LSSLVQKARYLRICLDGFKEEQAMSQEPAKGPPKPSSDSQRSGEDKTRPDGFAGQESDEERDRHSSQQPPRREGVVSDPDF
jgi:hypothetical protein